MNEPLRAYWSKLDRDQREMLAAACRTTAGHLANVVSGKTCGPALARHLQRETGGLVQPWDCRPEDWFQIWPELIGAHGAPAIAKAA